MADLKLETDAATIAWRTKKHAAWTKIQQDREAAYKQAVKNKNVVDATAFAGNKVRVPIREFLYEIIRRTSQVSALDFLQSAPLDWITGTEKLLDAGELVPRLVRRSYPAVMVWAQPIRLAEHASIKTNIKWHTWVQALGEPLGFQVAEEATVVGLEHPVITQAKRFGPYLLAAGVGTLVTVVLLRK